MKMKKLLLEIMFGLLVVLRFWKEAKYQMGALFLLEAQLMIVGDFTIIVWFVDCPIKYWKGKFVGNDDITLFHEPSWFRRSFIIWTLNWFLKPINLLPHCILTWSLSKMIVRNIKDEHGKEQNLNLWIEVRERQRYAFF